MNISEIVWKSVGRGAAHPSEVLNTLIELDNRKGQIGLWALENELRAKMPLLRPAARPLAQAWLGPPSSTAPPTTPRAACPGCFTVSFNPNNSPFPSPASPMG